VTDAVLRRLLLDLARERAAGATFCPSEVARRAATDWRSLMPRVRKLAADLIASGELVCTQRGQPAHPLTTQGAIRLAAAARK